MYLDWWLYVALVGSAHLGKAFRVCHLGATDLFIDHRLQGRRSPPCSHSPTRGPRPVAAGPPCPRRSARRQSLAEMNPDQFAAEPCVIVRSRCFYSLRGRSVPELITRRS